MSYDELVKALRETDFSDGCPCEAEELCKDNDCLITQAADAIEKLQGQINGWIEQERKAMLKSIPRWISVMERLPDAERGNFSKDVFVTDGQDVAISSWFNGDDFGSYWSYTGIGEVTRWMLLPQPPKEDEA